MVVGEAATAAGNEMSLSNMVLGFYEDAERERWAAEASAGDASSDDDEGSSGGRAESGAFWQEQRSWLQEAMARTSSAECRIKADTKDAVRQMRAAPGAVCSCAGATRASAAGGCCRGCALRFVAERLRDAGYNSAICRTRWPRTSEIPSGEHSYVDVVVPTRSGKAVRVVVEPGFRAEFVMARGGAEYKAMVAALPDLFVARCEKLRAVVGVMCDAARQCARESSLHMAPWRKHRYMEAKWLGTPERVAPGTGGAAAVPVGSALPEKQPRFRASMLTLDIGGRTAVGVA